MSRIASSGMHANFIKHLKVTVFARFGSTLEPLVMRIQTRKVMNYGSPQERKNPGTNTKPQCCQTGISAQFLGKFVTFRVSIII